MLNLEESHQKKKSLIELAEFLQNVSQAYKMNGVFHFYDVDDTNWKRIPGSAQPITVNYTTRIGKKQMGEFSLTFACRRTPPSDSFVNLAKELFVVFSCYSQPYFLVIIKKGTSVKFQHLSISHFVLVFLFEFPVYGQLIPASLSPRPSHSGKVAEILKEAQYYRRLPQGAVNGGVPNISIINKVRYN